MESAKSTLLDQHHVLPGNIGTDYNFKRKVVWFNALGFLLMHLGGLYGFYLCIYAKSLTIFWAMMIGVIGIEGVTIGAHRLYSHKAFKGTFSLRVFLTLLQTIAGQNCVYIWVRDHRLHHKYSDTDADPHNANRGFFFSHIGWLMSKKHPLVIQKGKTIDMSDLEADPVVMFQMKYYTPLYLIFALILPVALPVYLWDETFYNSFFISYLSRYIFTLNGTWSINSVTHLYGTKPYDGSIKAVENVATGILSLGEGWHNYHHAFPSDYKAAEFGVRYSVTTFLIESLAYFGYAYDLKEANPVTVHRKIMLKGDGTHPNLNKNRDVHKYIFELGQNFSNEDDTDKMYTISSQRFERNTVRG